VAMEDPRVKSKVAVVLDMMRKKGWRITPQRTIIVETILANIEKHPSLRQLHRMINEKLPGVGISTVYQTIKMLEELGVISTFEVNGRLHVDKFHPHVNIVCMNKDEIRDLEGIKQDDIIRILTNSGAGVKAVKNVLIYAEC